MKKNIILGIIVLICYIFIVTGLNYGIYSDINIYMQNPTLANYIGSELPDKIYEQFKVIRPFIVVGQILFSIIGVLGACALLYVAAILFLKDKLHFSDLLQACLISEFICIFHAGLNLLGMYTGFLHDGIQSVGSPLLLMQAQKLDIWLITVFNSMNMFWFAYIVVLILSVTYTCKITYKQSINIVLCSYGFVSMLMIVFTCLFMMLQ